MVNIEILGVNRNTDTNASDNQLTIVGRTLPWLQDTTNGSVWISWGVTYRDVRILDSRNQLYAVYNLTSQDLASATNRNALKQLFLEAARFADGDMDKLDDNWELLNFGNLSNGPLGDTDSDGDDNFTEYAFGTNPANPASNVKFHTALIGSPTNRSLAVTFYRRAGSSVNYAIDASFSVSPWMSSTSNLVMVDPFRNLFDGQGVGWSRCTIPASAGGSSRRFIRVRATPR